MDSKELLIKLIHLNMELADAINDIHGSGEFYNFNAMHASDRIKRELEKLLALL